MSTKSPVLLLVSNRLPSVQTRQPIGEFIAVRNSRSSSCRSSWTRNAAWQKAWWRTWWVEQLSLRTLPSLFASFTKASGQRPAATGQHQAPGSDLPRDGLLKPWSIFIFFIFLFSAPGSKGQVRQVEESEQQSAVGTCFPQLLRILVSRTWPHALFCRAITSSFSQRFTAQNDEFKRNFHRSSPRSLNLAKKLNAYPRYFQIGLLNGFVAT